MYIEIPDDEIQPTVYTTPNRQRTRAEQEIFDEAQQVISRTLLTDERAEGPAVFRYSAKEAFQKIAGKVVDTMEKQMAHKTDKRIRMLAHDLQKLHHTGFNDASRLGQVFKTCLFDEKMVANPLLGMRF